MMAPRLMMLACSRSRRRSRKRYLRRMSSGYSWSPNTGIGNSAAGPSTSISRANTSMSPVGRSGLSVPAGRCRTRPSIRTTHSDRSFSAVRNAGRVGVGDHLGEPVMVAQIDEQHAAMVADAMAPSRQPDRRSRYGRRAARRSYGYDSGASNPRNVRRACDGQPSPQVRHVVRRSLEARCNRPRRQCKHLRPSPRPAATVGRLDHPACVGRPLERRSRW